MELESLNFKVLLNDDEFKKKIEEDIKLAEELNSKLSDILNMKLDVPNVQKHTEAVKDTNKELSGTVDVMRTIAQLTGVAFGIAGIRRFASELIRTTGTFEVQKMALSSMLQDARKADEIFNTLRKNALESPYTFQDLTKFAKQLTAFNIPVENLVETEKRLADVSAGLGVDMSRIILAYGQVKAAGVLKGQELRQFTEAGVPILEQLAKQIEEVEGKTISLSEVFSRVSKKQIPFEMVEEAFKRMTDEGGKFYNMQEVLVETLQGKIGKLKDVWQQALYDLGTANSGILKDSVDLLTLLASHLDTIAKILAPVIAAFGAYYGALMLAAIGEKALAGVKVISLLTQVAMGSKEASVALKAMGVSAKAAAAALVALAAVALYELYNALNENNKELEEFKETLDSIHDNAVSGSGMAEVDRLRDLYRTLNDVNASYDDRKNALDQLNQLVPSYHGALDEEGRLIRGNTRDIEEYIKKLEQEAIVKGAQDELTELYNQKRLQERAVKEAQENYNAYKNAFQNMQTTYHGTAGAGDMQGAIASTKIQHAKNELDTAQQKLQLTINAIERVNAEIKNAGGLLLWGDDWNGPNNPKPKQQVVLENQIRLLEKFKDAYDKLLPYVGKENIANELKSIFDPTGENGYSFEDLDGQLNKLIDDLEKYDAQKAEQYRAQYGLGEVNARVKKYKEEEKAAKDAKEALDKYLDSLEKWANDTKELSGTGAAYGISKALADYKKAIKENNQQFWDKAVAGGKVGRNDLPQLMGLWAQNRASALATLKNNITKYADDILKEQMQGYDLTNWSDKSISQIKEIRDALLSVEVPENIKEELKEDSELLDLLIKELKRLAQEKVDKTVDPERWKKIAKQSKYIANCFLSVTDSLEKLGDATGNTQLSEFANSISRIAQNIKAAEEGYKAWGGWWGAIIGGGTNIITQVIDAITESEKKNTESTKEMAEAMERYKFAADKLAVSRHSSIFGTDELGQFRERVRLLNEYGDRTWKLIYSIKESGSDLFQSNDRKGLLAELEAAYDAGNIADETVKKYVETLRELDQTMESLFGNMASSAADKIVDSWIEAGNAALDYADILDDVAKSYAKMLIQSMIMDTFLDPITDDLKNSFINGDYGNAMELIAGAMEGISNSAPMFEEILSAFDPYFNREGSSSTNSLGNGIKSITEDTANLLASYINAIRADVSVMRGLQEKGFSNLEILAGVITPSLAEHVQQIAANTANCAENTREILSALKDVIGSPDTSGLAVRVTPA